MAPMTFMEFTCELPSPLKPAQLRALSEFANTYGLHRIHLDEASHRLRVEYDASRLKETQVLHMLHKARIPVTGRAE